MRAIVALRSRLDGRRLKYRGEVRNGSRPSSTFARPANHHVHQRAAHHRRRRRHRRRAMDAGNMMKPMLARGELRLVRGDHAGPEYCKHREDAALGAVSTGVRPASRRWRHHRHPCAGSKTATRLPGAHLRLGAGGSCHFGDRYIIAFHCPTEPSTWSTRATSRLRMEVDSRPVRSTRSAAGAGWRSKVALSKRRRGVGGAVGQAALQAGRPEREVGRAHPLANEERDRNRPRPQEQLEACARRSERAERDGDAGQGRRAAPDASGWRRSSTRRCAWAQAREQVMLKGGRSRRSPTCRRPIPAVGCWKGETASCCAWKTSWASRIIGQPAVPQSLMRCGAAPNRSVRPQPAHRGTFAFPRPDRCQQRPEKPKGAGRR